MANKFGEYLKQRRKELGYTMKEVAVLVDCHYSLISAYELGKRRPSLRILKRVADLFELSYLELLKMRDDLKENNEFESATYTKMLLAVTESQNRKFKEALHTIRMLATREDSREEIKTLATEVLIAHDPENQVQCFPCHTDVMFRYFGQTKTYDANLVSKKYLKQYQKEYNPIISCSKCAREVYYEKQDDGTWEEYVVK